MIYLLFGFCNLKFSAKKYTNIIDKILNADKLVLEQLNLGTKRIFGKPFDNYGQFRDYYLQLLLSKNACTLSCLVGFLTTKEVNDYFENHFVLSIYSDCIIIFITPFFLHLFSITLSSASGSLSKIAFELK